MRRAIFAGLGFGLTSGVITTLGLMVGLFSAVHSKLVVIGGILTIAVADSLSDSLGMHISEEAENHHSKKQIWAATISTFISKLVLALSFIIPVLLLELNTAIIVSIIYGFLVLIILSFHLAVKNKDNKIKVISEHLIIAILVVVITYFVGRLISIYFI